MGALLEDPLAQGRRRHTDLGRVLADALDGPARMAAMAGGHVLGRRAVMAVAAHARMGGDPFALVEDLDASDGEARLDFGPNEAIGDAVVVRRDLDVIIDADAAHSPFREGVGFRRQGLERRLVDLLEELSSRRAETPDRPDVVEVLHQVGEGRVDIGQMMESAVAESAEQPSLDHQNRLLDFRFIARATWACRQDGGVVMGRHVGIGPVDLRLVEAGLDHRDLGIVRHQEMGHAADSREGLDVSVDPVGEALRQGRAGEGEAGGAEHRDEDLRHPDLAGEPIDDRHPVARIIDEQALTGRIALPHGGGQAAFEDAVEFAEPGIAVTARMSRDILVPEDRQRDVLALEVAVNPRPIGFGVTAMTLLRAGIGIERRF